MNNNNNNNNSSLSSLPEAKNQKNELVEDENEEELMRRREDVPKMSKDEIYDEIADKVLESKVRYENFIIKDEFADEVS